jgi:ferredoxin-NADP reductase
MRCGAVDGIALETCPDLKGWKVFLCGNPELVKQVQRKTFMAGASMKDIHADAFLPAKS